VITDGLLAQEIATLHKEIEKHGDAVSLEDHLFEALQQLIRRHAIADSSPSPLRPDSTAVLRALELLNDPNLQSTSLEELSAAVGLSPYHFLRTFKLQTGLPPHQYHLNVRLERGRRLLREGCGIAEAAARTGFADQSHFTRGFRRFFGVTPGRYMTARSFKTSQAELQ
jgi:AraC-like DNA-binding protein